VPNQKVPQLQWTTEHAILIDHVGNEVYASHYSERKTYRFLIVALTLLLAVSVFAMVSLSKRKLVYRYIRIDEMGRAQAIQYNDLSYTPREGEIRTYLTDWANYRYTINRETIAKKYPLNYYFLSQSLASQLMGEDNQNHLVSQVIGGQIEQSEVEVKGITITSMNEETVQGVRFARGTALVNIDKLYSPRYSHQSRTEHWVLSVTYYLNPAIVNEQARALPQFETLNPLGLVITEFHENRVSVGSFGGGPNAGSPYATTDAIEGITR
jgi:type IV secretion system protein VirB5